MLFNTGAALLDAIVLAVVARESEGTYGYKITQEVRQVIELSESTLYRYYKVTSRGWAQLHLYESEWRSYSDKITGLFEGKLSDRSEA